MTPSFNRLVWEEMEILLNAAEKRKSPMLADIVAARDAMFPAGRVEHIPCSTWEHDAERDNIPAAGYAHIEEGTEDDGWYPYCDECLSSFETCNWVDTHRGFTNLPFTPRT